MIVIGQTPTYALPVPRYAAFQSGLERLPAKDHSHVNELLGQISTRYGATFHNPYSGTCNESKCLALAEGMPLHWDFGHLTAEGSVYFSTGLVETIKAMKN